MILKLIIVFLAFVSFSKLAQGQDFPFTPDTTASDFLFFEKNDELTSIMDLVEAFKSVMSQIKKIRKSVKSSPDDVMEILDYFNKVNTSSLCGKCQNVVTKFRKHTNPKLILTLFETAAVAMCQQHYNISVCLGYVKSYGQILFDAIYDNMLTPSNLCENVFMCPKTDKRDRVKDYVQEVLKDKPVTDIPKPTKKSTYTVLHLTDPHIDLQYEAGTNGFCDQPICCRAGSGAAPNPSKEAGYWGTLGDCDLPERTFQQFLQFVAKNFDVDMIFWTGDNVSHDIWNQNSDNQTINTYDATQDILTYFPNAFIYPMFGNHEAYPCDEFDFAGNASDWLKDSLSSMWKGWLDNEALETFREYSYYSMVNSEHNVKIIALNTIACDSNDFYLITDPTDPSHQLEWLRQQLYDAENSNQAVFIIGHIPPGDFTCTSQWSARYRALIDRFTNIIRGQFFGHTHNDQFQIVRSYADNSPVGTVYIAPSMTTFSRHRPAFRIFEIDSETNIPVNYYQYRLDLNKWNKKNTSQPIEWDLEYSFTQEYKLPDMSFQSYNQLNERINSDYQTALLYSRNMRGWAQGPSAVSPRVQQHLYCQTKYSVSADAFICLGLNATTSDLMKIAQQMLPGFWHFSDC